MQAGVHYLKEGQKQKTAVSTAINKKLEGRNEGRKERASPHKSHSFGSVGLRKHT